MYMQISDLDGEDNRLTPRIATLVIEVIISVIRGWKNGRSYMKYEHVRFRERPWSFLCLSSHPQF